MTKCWWFVVLGVVLVSNPQSSWADAITIVQLSPSILVDASAGATSTGPTTLVGGDVLSNSIGAIDPATGASATATATLRSNTTTTTFSGQGTTGTSTNTTSVRAGAHAQTQYFTTFDVNQPQQFDFSGAFNTSAPPTNTNRSAWRTELFLFPNVANPSTVFDVSAAISQLLSFSGVLPPGRYGFQASSVSDTSEAIGVAQTGTDFRFTLAFRDVGTPAPTPEPATVALLAAGLAGVAGRRLFSKRPA